MNDDHFLLVPTDGILHIFEVEKPLDIEATLRANGADGVLASMNYWGVTIQWLVSNDGPVNQRARETLVEIGGPHTIFTGPVMFSGMEPEEVAMVVAHLSRRE